MTTLSISSSFLKLPAELRYMIYEISLSWIINCDIGFNYPGQSLSAKYSYKTCRHSLACLQINKRTRDEALWLVSSSARKWRGNSDALGAPSQRSTIRFNRAVFLFDEVPLTDLIPSRSEAPPTDLNDNEGREDRHSEQRIQANPPHRDNVLRLITVLELKARKFPSLNPWTSRSCDKLAEMPSKCPNLETLFLWYSFDGIRQCLREQSPGQAIMKRIDHENSFDNSSRHVPCNEPDEASLTAILSIPAFANLNISPTAFYQRESYNLFTLQLRNWESIKGLDAEAEKMAQRWQRAIYEGMWHRFSEENMSIEEASARTFAER